MGSRPLKILFAIAEAYPFIKVGDSPTWELLCRRRWPGLATM